jgi:hypothetical protein
MTMRRVLVLAVLALLLPKPCAASDPTPLIAMMISVPAVFSSVLVLALASFAPRAGFFASLVFLLIFVGISTTNLGDNLLYLSMAINVIALVVSVAKLSKRPEEADKTLTPGE